MSSEFVKYELGDLVDLVIDYRGKTPKKLGGNWSETGIKALSAKNIKTGKIIREDTIRYVDSELYKKWMKEEIRRNDILITSEAPFGEVFFWDSDEKIVLSQRLFAVRCNEEKVNPKFVYFYMTSDEFQWELQSRATGTTVKGLRQPELLKCNLLIPSYENQLKISEILSNLENKINVLKKINQNLESLIKFVFDYWFLQFDFPNEDNNPYCSSNGSMIKDDVLNIDIPEYFSCERLDDFVDFVRGMEPGSKNYNEIQNDGFIPFIRVGDLGSCNNCVFIERDLANDKILKSDDIILTLDGTVGIVKVGLNGAYSTGLRKLVIKDDRINKPFLYCLIKSQYIQEIIQRYATGSNILHASSSIKHMNFILPEKEIMDKFNKLGSPILNQIVSNIKEIEDLIALRDFLLPLMMSGQITFKD